MENRNWKIEKRMVRGAAIPPLRASGMRWRSGRNDICSGDVMRKGARLRRRPLQKRSWRLWITVAADYKRGESSDRIAGEGLCLVRRWQGRSRGIGGAPGRFESSKLE